MTNKAARFAAVLGTLHAAHNLADHVVQTDAQAVDKTDPDPAIWLPGMAGHVGSYHAAQLAALLAVDRMLSLGLSRRRLAAAVAVSAGTHALVDRRWPVRRLLELTGSPGFARGTYKTSDHRHGLSAEAERTGPPFNGLALAPIPLHGPYLADQALHHACLWVAALIASGGRP